MGFISAEKAEALVTVAEAINSVNTAKIPDSASALYEVVNVLIKMHGMDFDQEMAFKELSGFGGSDISYGAME